MFRVTPRVPALLIPVVVAMTVAACTVTGGGVLPTPVSSPEPATPSPVPPSASQPPSGPIASPPPSAPAEEPIEVVRFDIGGILRAMEDGIPVRLHPDLDAALVDGYDQASGEAVEDLMLMTGDQIGAVLGPFYADGHTWYWVQHHDVRSTTFESGWVTAESLEQVGLATPDPVLVAIDGLGSGGAGTGQARAGAGLYVNVAVTPMPGEERCEAEVILIGTDGAATTLAGGEITETMILFSSPLENRATVQEHAGDFTLQVKTDCSWAGMAFEPQV